MSTRAVCLLMLVLSGVAQKIPAQQPHESLTDLPLITVPAKQPSDRLAVFYSGDGGWAGLDKAVSAQLAAAGMTVIGVNSRGYFWQKRSPDESTRDLRRILQFYLQDRPMQDRVVLVGYSTGAEVLPFMANRLPEALRARIASIALIAPGRDATFEIRLTDWIPGSHTAGLPLMPEVERLRLPLLCLWGEGDRSALCPELPLAHATTVLIGSGHHLGGEYQQIAAQILSFAAPGAAQP